MSIGFIKLQRSVIGTWIHENPVYFKAYCDILFNVNWEEKITLVGFEHMKCGIGEALYSLDSWAKIFGGDWNKNKVRRFFSRLERGNAIRTQSERTTTRLTLVNIDTPEQERNAKGTQKERNPTPTKEERNKKKEIKEKESKKEKALSLQKKIEQLEKENLELKNKKEKEKKEVPAEKKESRDFPKKEAAKKYDIRDKRLNKHLPFDILATKKTLDYVFPTLDLIAKKHKEITGRDISEEFIKEEKQSFIEKAITNNYQYINSVDLLLSKFSGWLIMGEKHQKNKIEYKSKSNNSLDDIMMGLEY